MLPVPGNGAKYNFLRAKQSMFVDSAFAQLGENQESDESVNPIVTPASSSHTPMADNTSNNGDNDR